MDPSSSPAIGASPLSLSDGGTGGPSEAVTLEEYDKRMEVHQKMMQASREEFSVSRDGRSRLAAAIHPGQRERETHARCTTLTAPIHTQNMLNELKMDWEDVFEQTVGRLARQMLTINEDQWGGSVRDLHGRVRAQWIETQLKLQESLAQLRRLMDASVFHAQLHAGGGDAEE